MAQSHLSELDTLQKTLNLALDNFRTEISESRLPQLSLSASSPHPLDLPDCLPSRRLYETRRLVLSCVDQIKQILQPPYEKVVEQSCAVYDTATLDVFVKTGIFDALADASALKNGLHVLELQSRLGLDAGRLNTILRYLAMHGWVRERREGRFALNRPSLELSKGRNGRRWVFTTGKPEIAASLLDWIVHPEWRFSHSIVQTAFQLANNTELSIFDWLKRRPAMLEQWSLSVQSLGDASALAILTDYPWKLLAPDTIIDLGGGRGDMSLRLANTFPFLKFIIQDLPEVLPLAIDNLESQSPGVTKDRLMTVEAHNFFMRQPRTGDAYSYLFRHVLHDWSNADAIKILSNVAEAAGPKSKVIIIETISVPGTILADMPNGHVDESNNTDVAGPLCLPSNFGLASKATHALAVHLMSAFNARERTLNEWQDVISCSGLTIFKVYPLRASVSIIECRLPAVNGHIC